VRRVPVSLALALGVLPLVAGVRLQWSRVTRYEPLPPALDASLVPGRTELDACLATLGAPLWVFELPVEGSGGAMLAWGWYEQSDFGFRASYSFDRGVTASFDWQQVEAGMEGLVAVFDEDWTLVSLDRGLLRDLVTEDRRPRPTVQGLEDG